MTHSTCRPGSAWDTWAKEGLKMRGCSAQAIEQAAKDFALNENWPPQAQGARYRAFIEGATT